MRNQSQTNLPEGNIVNQPIIQPQATSSNSNKISFILAIFITFLVTALVFGLAGYYFGTKSQELKPPHQVAPTPTIEQATPTPILKTTNDQTLRDIASLLTNEEFVPIDRQTMWWVSNDNWSILVDASESIGLVRTKAYSELQDTTSVTSKIVENVSSYFINQGYSQNQNNSSQSTSDDSFYDYIKGFENDKEKCLLSVNPDESYYQDENKQMVAVPNIVISCSNSSSFDASYKKQIPYLKAMNDRKAVVYIQEETDTAAKANVNWRRTGAFALFSKNNGYWEMIYRGQDQPSCKVLEEYNFPKEIHDSCF